MRFSTAHLMLLITSWVVAYMLAPFLTFETVRASYHDSVTKSSVRNAVLYGRPYVGRSPKTKADLLSKSTDPWTWKDSWGRPLQILENDIGKLRRDAGDVLVYSMGFDGKTTSFGNDPDDINSWDNHHHEFYRVQRNKWDRTVYLWRTVWATPVAFAIICWLFKIAKPGRKQIAG